MLVCTRRGHMARRTGWMRPRYSQIYALCARDEVAGGLTLSSTVTPFVVPFDMINPENTIDTALKTLAERRRLTPRNTVVSSGALLVRGQSVDAVQRRVR